ncbi:hypothetical protein [Actinopolymorpha pittospori]|uniref:Uncharacterized protein n=1 Tax=Actinopolymorpha pittospori TaxID=648752 RepID=A0A927N3V0_9ACTN|nr:hypothetical protein [Actinopolymorpha pittospori]MBE1611831.1 hypothetical protein [Actinopolymorpha pittospori]
MKERYTYEIATNEQGDGWQRTVLRDDEFSRPPASVVRSLLESWIIDHPGQLTGGERVHVYDLATRTPLAHDGGRVRVLLYRGRVKDHQTTPAATGYLALDERDFPTVDPHDPGERWRRMRASARRAATDRRVGAGAAALLTLTLGYVASRKLRTRRGGLADTLLTKAPGRRSSRRR